MKDAQAWKSKHNCDSCHHAGLVVWAMSEAWQNGHSVTGPVLAELTKWVAESDDGRTGVPRPAAVPKARNAKAGWLALALGADRQPDAVVQKGLNLLRKMVKSDQADKGSWAYWPETQPPIIGNSDESMTVLATLSLLPAAASGDGEGKVVLGKGVQWLALTKTDDDPQSMAIRLVLWKRLAHPAKEWEALIRGIKEQQNEDGGWSQAKDMASDARRPGRLCMRWPTRAASPMTPSSDADMLF